MNEFITFIEEALIAFGNYAWGTPLLILLVGGGFYFTVYSRFLPFTYFGHAINVLRGKYDDPNDPGDISHYQALSGAIAATVGMGNISGVAVAIVMGGPGTIFWMWISAIIGISTKFFTCTLAVMFRGKDSLGHEQGGPMYVIREGLSKKWHWLAVLFSVAGMFGVLPIFQANQLTQIIREYLLFPDEVTAGTNTLLPDFLVGVAILVVVSAVILGGIKRIGLVAGRMVPFMVVLYTACVLYIILGHWEEVPANLALIFRDAFTGEAAMGGAVGAVIIAGARRAAFSNEAGIGTAPMMHGAAKTQEPIREGLVAMMGPVIDTILICTMTALAILVTGAWKFKDLDGVALTAKAFEQGIPGSLGIYLLMLCVLVFALTTMFSMSYYGSKCFGFLFGAQHQHLYLYFYVASIIFGAVASVAAVISLIDGMYATMAVPTMVSALLLSPKVRQAANTYFQQMKEQVKVK